MSAGRAQMHSWPDRRANGCQALPAILFCADMGIRIVHLADYGALYGGSFVPMLRALAIEARRRGHDPVMRFSERARGRNWLPELEMVADVGFLAPGRGPRVAHNIR